MPKILQWNINGLFNNWTDLLVLIKEHNPVFISLQETHLPHNFTAHPPMGYAAYFNNLSHNNSSKQGVGVMIRRDIPHFHIDVVSSISTIAIELNLGFKITIISMYIPPCQTFSSAEILDVLKNFNTPILLLGDFNAWSHLWGSANTNSRGSLLEDVILSYDLAILNTGAPTHFSTHCSFTNVDLTLCSSSLFPMFSWYTLDCLHGSDHYPIITSFDINTPNTPTIPRAKFLIDQADWPKFQSSCCLLASRYPISTNVNKEAATIKKIILTAAHLSIPQTKRRKISRAVPWWNNDLAQLRTDKQIAWHNLKKKHVYR